MVANTSAVGYDPVNVAGDTMLGYLILNADPVALLGAATKQYVDATATGLSVKAAVVAASTVALTTVYANGAAGVGATLTNAGAMAAFTLDCVALALNDRVLIKNQASTFENGIYTVTTVGSGAVNWVLTRATDYDQAPAEIDPGNLVIVNSGTTQAVTSWMQTATVAVIGTDPILFSQFTASPSTFATTALSNLAAVAINASLTPNVDVAVDVGSAAKRWNNVYAQNIKSGTSAAQTLTISGYDVDGAADTPFITITSNNTPTCVLASSVTSTTQAPGDNSTKLATTAYADAISASGANVHLSNLAGVAINTTLLPDGDNAWDLGSAAFRWKDTFAKTIKTGVNAADDFTLQAYDVDGASYTTFLTLTANNTPTMSLAGAVTGVTQAALDNSTKLATTAYVDAATGGGSGANIALSNLAAVAINTSLLPGADNSIDAGNGTKRFRQLYSAGLTTGTTAADTLVISARDVDGASNTAFITLTANNTPTCVLASAVTGTTQAANDNSTKLATTAYVDTAGASYAVKALSNLAAVAINTSLLPASDNAIDCGDGTHRFRQLFSAGLTTGTTAADTLVISARDVDGASDTPFITLTANNTPTCVLASAVTATTQAALDNSTKIATTAYVDAATGGGSGANVHLSNLSAVAINTTLVSDTDVTDDLGQATVRWNNLFAAAIKTGSGAGNTTVISAHDVDGASDTAFITLTANNTPTCVLASAVTGTTQAASDNSTKLATTAYADAQVVAIAANKALSNLAAVAINTSLLPASDNAIDCGDGTHRFRQLYSAGLTTGTTAADTLVISARDVDGASNTAFITLTANNTPTCVLASAVTATTQAANDNSTKLATTAYVDTADGNFAVKALSNLASVAINTSLLPASDNAIDVGDGTHRMRQMYSAGLTTGTTAADTLIISARDVDGASNTAFITLTANNTPTCVLASAVTGTTQSPNDNSTKLATTAYVDAAAAGGGVNLGKIYPIIIGQFSNQETHMAANTSPIYTLTPVLGFVAVTGVDGSMDGTDADVKVVYTAGSNGGFIQKLKLQPISTSGSTTTSAAAARIYINNGSTAGTASNNSIYTELTLAAIAVNVAGTTAVIGYELPLNWQVPNGYKIMVGITAMAANTQWQVVAVAGDY